MNLLKAALLCSLLCTVTPSKAIYVYVDQRAVEELASQFSLSTAKVILSTTIAFIAGGIIGSFCAISFGTRYVGNIPVSSLSLLLSQYCDA